MQNEIEIKGLFYEKEGYKFRKFLDIKSKNTHASIPDLMVIMMNPGSSKPLDGIDNSNKVSEAKPDRTQDQIIRIMLHFDYQYARILNLSDLRQAKSKMFYPKIMELKEKKIIHSIFDKERISDFENLFITDVPVLCAWGVSRKLKDLAFTAMQRIDDMYSIGLKKEGTEWGYYHPLPPNYKKQHQWINSIIKLMQKHQNQSSYL